MSWRLGRGRVVLVELLWKGSLTQNGSSIRPCLSPAFAYLHMVSFALYYTNLHTLHLKALPRDPTFEGFSSLRHQVVWFGQTSPDLFAVAKIVPQGTEGAFARSNMKVIYDEIFRTQAYPNQRIMIPALHDQALRIVVFKDALFMINAYLSTQLGIFIFLFDRT